jgi:hypothetical protein
MTKRTIALPELFLIAGTRVALGIGVGLLLSRRMSDEQCSAAGKALVAVGVISTIPLAIHVLGSKGESEAIAA